MIKLMGLLLLFSSAALTGLYASAALGEREQVIHRQITFWRQFSLQLECLRASPRQIVSLLTAQQEFADDRFLQRLGNSFGASGSFREALERAVKSSPWLRDCGVDDILLPLGDVIGIRELESQLAALSSAALLLEERQQAVSLCYRQKGGLYRRLGIMGGLLLAVLFF